jgi:hypothetical protein
MSLCDDDIRALRSTMLAFVISVGAVILQVLVQILVYEAFDSVGIVPALFRAVD